MKFRQNEEAVSPVIGVILMVAITVILAAVIAAFVFGMGTPSKTPQANMQITKADVSDGYIKIEHKGGEPLSLVDFKITLTYGGSTQKTWDPVSNTTLGKAMTVGDTLYLNASDGLVLLNGVSASNTTGATVTPAGAFTLTAGQNAKVKFIYLPSGQVANDIEAAVVS